jgi:hypothetical protein
VAKIHQTELITRKSYYTNYDVLADGIVVDRIMKAPAVPAGLSWMRTLAFDYFLIALPALAWFEAHGEGAARQRTMVEAVSTALTLFASRCAERFKRSRCNASLG